MTSALLAAFLMGAAPKVVAPEWNAVNVKKDLAAFYADSLAEGLRKQGLQVVTAQDIATLLGMERQKALLGCAESGESCMAELANALGADATLTVNLAQFADGGFRGVAKLISSRSGETISSVTLDAPNERKLLIALDSAAGTLAAPFIEKKTQPVAVTSPAATVKPGITKYWWVFGVSGVVIGGLGGAGVGGAYAKVAELRSATTPQVADRAAAEGRSLQFAGWLGVGLGSALLVTSIVMLAWPGVPVTPTVGVSSSGATVGVGGAF